MGDQMRRPVSYRAFLDYEFLERGRDAPVVPISVGMVREDVLTGEREGLYLEYKLSVADAQAVSEHPWICEHVLPNLVVPEHQRVSRPVAARRMASFLGDGASTVEEIWTWYGAYDWVLFSQDFGRMIDLPSWLPRYTMDLKAWQVQNRMPRHWLPGPTGAEHNALADAWWNASVFSACCRWAATAKMPPPGDHP